MSFTTSETDGAVKGEDVLSMLLRVRPFFEKQTGIIFALRSSCLKETQK